MAWEHCFAGQAGVEVVDGDICQLACDAIVSPANSFGFMDGGLDRELSEHFGWNLEKQVQAAIQARPMRELLIGEALIVPTHHPKTPWLIVAPTMRVPMRIRTSIHAYLAMKAILLTAQAHREEPKIQTLAISGLGTGVGQLAPELCAGQMWQAYREVVLGEFEAPTNFVEAQKTHLKLNGSGLLYD
jgi:O-acetyl-ADP-ribose deacetylase (regulator of RNase III)